MSNTLRTLLRYLYQLSVMILLLYGAGCTIKPDDLSSNTSIEEILNLAEAAQKKKSFKEAGDFYMKLDQLYTYSDESREALVKAMKSYHEGTELLDARLSAKRYLLLYPKGPDAAFSQYMVGLSFFDAIVDVRRDQGAALHAVREFQQLILEYPASSYSSLVNKKLQISYSQLAGQEMSVGRYYLKREEYLAAINRFSIVVNKYMNTIFSVEAFFRLTEAYVALDMRDLAIENNILFLKKFPNSEWSSKSNSLVSKFN
ncbi:MAG: outer membrane protein assembly factor BamD [Paracoccaceae bacterium]|nr:outer membrane protein assembly factor BamD [Paracoccaceae bacterium]